MKPTFALLAASCFAASAHAESRELGAHEHGWGALNIAVEKYTVLMELEAPGADIVGFEHPAELAEDRAAIEAAIVTLEQPLALFVPAEAAGCAVNSASVRLLTEGEDNDEHDHEKHDHDEEKHADHDHDEHDHDEEEHDHDDDHTDHEDGGHTEFRAEYELNCADPSALSVIDFAYFARFPNAEGLAVQLISGKGAKGFEVERAEPRLDLSGAI